MTHSRNVIRQTLHCCVDMAKSLVAIEKSLDLLRKQEKETQKILREIRDLLKAPATTPKEKTQ